MLLSRTLEGSNVLFVTPTVALVMLGPTFQVFYVPSARLLGSARLEEMIPTMIVAPRL